MERRRENSQAFARSGRQDLNDRFGVLWNPALACGGATMQSVPPLRASFLNFIQIPNFAMLDDSLKNQLKAYLEYLKQPIELVFSADDSEGSRDMKALLTDIAEASTMVQLVPANSDSERAPSFSIRRVGEQARVSFAGLPLGHEFTSLVLALLHVGGHAPKVSDEVLAQVESLSGEFHFETYFS